MDIGALLSSGLGTVAMKLVVGGAVAAASFALFKNIEKNLILKFKDYLEHKILDVKDARLRALVREAVLFVAQKLEGASNDEKFAAAKAIVIREAKAHVPDFVLSDEKVELLIESALKDIKDTLMFVGSESDSDEHSDGK